MEKGHFKVDDNTKSNHQADASNKLFEDAFYLLQNFRAMDADHNGRVSKGELGDFKELLHKSGDKSEDKTIGRIRKHFKEICNLVDDQQGKETGITFSDVFADLTKHNGSELFS